MTDLTQRIAQMEADLATLKRAQALLVANGDRTDRSPCLSSKGHPFGNGEPDAELAKAAGISLAKGNARPDKWRQYLALRRKGWTFWKAAGKVNVHQTTAQRLEALV